ncbi:MAG: hypothetical protein WCF67_19565 [Chitinophagaceae bacterium]
MRGKVVYVSPSREVKFKFRFILDNYSFVEKSQAGLFKVQPGSKTLVISSVVQNFKPVNLVITEGENTHLLILTYKENLNEATEIIYDFSIRQNLPAEPTNKYIVEKRPPAKSLKPEILNVRLQQMNGAVPYSEAVSKSFTQAQVLVAKQLTSENLTTIDPPNSLTFNTAMDYYRKAQKLRSEREYADSYKMFEKFLQLATGADLGVSSADHIYYINEAKNYVTGFRNYLSMPKTMSAPKRQKP